MKTKIQKKSLLVKVGIVTLAVIVVVSSGIVVKAQMEKSRIAELTALAVALNNADVFLASLDYINEEIGDTFGSSGTRWPNGISADTTSPNEGEVRGTTLTITSGNDVTQSSIATSTATMTELGNLSIYDSLRFGDSPDTDADGIEYHYVSKSFTAASNTLFAIQIAETDGATVNPNIYLEELGLQFTGMPTSTMQFFVGTSSTAFVNRLEYEAVLNIADDSLCSLMDDVLMTDTGVFDATNTVIWAQSDAAGTFAGCDVGFGTDFREVPLIPGDWIIGFASTTEYAVGVSDGTKTPAAGDYLDGNVFIIYKTVK